jgi:single-strand DNA-binding protein
MGINKVILLGNVGRDPEVQYVKEDVPVTRFSLATSETYKDKNGEKITTTEWHNIVLWRGLAKIAEKYVKKGDQLYIEGKITTRNYEKDGQTKYFTEIIASNMQMLGRSSGQGTSSGTSTPNTSQNNVNESVQNIQEHVENVNFVEADDLPF